MPSAHFVTHSPPQSTPDSLPSCLPLSHSLATHKRFCTLQLADAQSALVAQLSPTAHFVAHVPPQSTPVSWPFCLPSSHSVATHTRFVVWQKVDAQSAPVWQP